MSGTLECNEPTNQRNNKLILGAGCICAEYRYLCEIQIDIGTDLRFLSLTILTSQLAAGVKDQSTPASFQFVSQILTRNNCINKLVSQVHKHYVQYFECT